MPSIRAVSYWCWIQTLSTGSFLIASVALAQGITGTIRDQTGGALPGVTVEARAAGDHIKATTTDATGVYRLDVPAGHYELTFSLVNFAPVRRSIELSPTATRPNVDAVLRFILSADVTVTGKRTFTNLADAEVRAKVRSPRSSSTRPVMRSGEVLETVPGVIASQHSGEGKADQYYLRGFNLDHGTDFASTVAGMPVNMPTHAHGLFRSQFSGS